MLVKTVVKRPLAAVVLFLSAAVLGLFFIPHLSWEPLPRPSSQSLTVTTLWEGRGPDQTEARITQPLEDRLAGLPQLQKISSVSREGESRICLDFLPNTDLTQAADEVRLALAAAADQLPREAAVPTVTPPLDSESPVLELALTSDTASASPAEWGRLTDLAEKILVPRLTMAGASGVILRGGAAPEVAVEVSPRSLDAAGLNLSQVAQVLKGQDGEQAAGVRKIEPRDKPVRSDNQFRTSDQFRTADEVLQTVLTVKKGEGAPRVLRLQDLAAVTTGYRFLGERVRIDGHPGVLLEVQAPRGTGDLTAARALKAQVPGLTQALPAGTRLLVTQDPTARLEPLAGNLVGAGLAGIVLAALLVLWILRSWRGLVILFLSWMGILALTLGALGAAGRSLTLGDGAALVLLMGLFTTWALAVLGNIVRCRELGLGQKTSAVRGTAETAADLGAMALTAAAFALVPVFFSASTGQAHALFSSLAFTLILAIAMVLAVIFLLVPVLSGRWGLRNSAAPSRLDKHSDRNPPTMTLMTRTAQGYQGLLTRLMRHRWITGLTVGGIVAVSLLLVPALPTGKTPAVLPLSNEVRINLEMPGETNPTAADEALVQMETLVKSQVKDCRTLVRVVDTNRASPNGFLRFTWSPGDSGPTDTLEGIKTRLYRHFHDIPGAEFSFAESADTLVEVKVQGSRQDQVRESAAQIRTLLRTQGKDVAAVTGGPLDRQPQELLEIDRNQAQALGLGPQAVTQEFQGALGGIPAGTLHRADRDLPLVVRWADNPEENLDKARVHSLDQAPGAASGPVFLSNLAQPRKTWGTGDLRREDRLPTVRLTAVLAPGTSAGATVAPWKDLIQRSLPADSGLRITVSAEQKNSAVHENLWGLWALALVLSFVVLVVRFESLLSPLVLLTAPVLALPGLLIVYGLTGTPWSSLTAVVLALLTILVTAVALPLVSGTQTLRRRGVPPVDAAAEAGGQRFIPAVSTALVLLLALVPVVFLGGSFPFLGQTALAVIGGLVSATLLLLVLIPVLEAAVHSLADDWQAWFRDRQKDRQRQEKAREKQKAKEAKEAKKQSRKEAKAAAETVPPENTP